MLVTSHMYVCMHIVLFILCRFFVGQTETPQTWEDEFLDHSDIEEPPRPKLLPYFGRLAPMPPMDPYAKTSTSAINPGKPLSRCIEAFRGFTQHMFNCCSA